jgi:hypothetical protein
VAELFQLISFSPAMALGLQGGKRELLTLILEIPAWCEQGINHWATLQDGRQGKGAGFQLHRLVSSNTTFSARAKPTLSHCSSLGGLGLPLPGEQVGSQSSA